MLPQASWPKPHSALSSSAAASATPAIANGSSNSSACSKPSEARDDQKAAADGYCVFQNRNDVIGDTQRFHRARAHFVTCKGSHDSAERTQNAAKSKSPPA